MFVEIGECAIILSLTFYRTVSALTRTVSWLASKNDVARIVLASLLRAADAAAGVVSPSLRGRRASRSTPLCDLADIRFFYGARRLDALTHTLRWPYSLFTCTPAVYPLTLL